MANAAGSGPWGAGRHGARHIDNMKRVTLVTFSYIGGLFMRPPSSDGYRCEGARGHFCFRLHAVGQRLDSRRPVCLQELNLRDASLVCVHPFGSVRSREDIFQID